MASNEDLLARRAAVVAPGVAQFAGPVTAVSAKGAVITDAEGRQILDFGGGIGVMNVGHSHPAVVAAIQAQARDLQHACIHVATYEPYVALCEKLVELLPHGDSTKVMLVNSGAEAVENAVKIARQATGRSGVIWGLAPSTKSAPRVEPVVVSRQSPGVDARSVELHSTEDGHRDAPRVAQLDAVGIAAGLDV